MRISNHEATLKSLETQMGQVSQFINTRQNEGFLSDTEVTRKPTHEQCKAITTRSGKQLQEPIIIETSGKEMTLQTPTENTGPTERKKPTTVTPATTAEEVEEAKEEAEDCKPPQIRFPCEGRLEDCKPYLVMHAVLGSSPSAIQTW
ncbi:hypothetical protein HRI_003172400 [Hibiscus trionum]|uniref:Uncharacterized protein n=1 Tax=Hibiscus trionum TaxID=183268 RepID=A0A9W7MBX3_HIBTR|nr:hypothetical protein HRI_003172400 [Hibiscus trionum]